MVRIRSSTDTNYNKCISGVVCMMIGYTNQHSGDTYRMNDPVTRRTFMQHTRCSGWVECFGETRDDAITNGYCTIEVPEQLGFSVVPFKGAEEHKELESGAISTRTQSGRQVI
jgi:hypothetical protein